MLIILGPYTERYRLSADTSLFQLVTQGHLAEIEYPGPTVQLLPVRSSVTRICYFSFSSSTRIPPMSHIRT